MSLEREHVVDQEPVKAGEPYRPWAELAHRFATNRLALGGLVVIGALVAVSAVYFGLELTGGAWP
ncbi:MAG: hypothetical protein ACE1ZU_08160, partial [bacterium]